MAPRTTITAKAALGPYTAVTAGTADFVFTAADVANGNQVASTGNDLILVFNSDVTNPYTVTFTGVVDPFNRSGNITTYSLAALELAAFGPFPGVGWKNSDGYLYINGSNAAIKVAAISLG